MILQNQLAWLEEQLEAWVDDELISSDQAKAIRERYSNESISGLNLTYILLGSLATLLVGSGIVLIFAYQWEKLSELAKGLLSVVPTILGLILLLYAFLNQRSSITWRESASGFMMLMIAASMGLWGQTFDVFQEAQEFWLVWTLLSLPLLFLMNSSFAALLFGFGIVAGVLNSNGDYPLYFAGMFVGYAAHLAYNLKINSHVTRLNLLAWAFAVIFSFVWSVVMQSITGPMSFLGYTACLGVFYILGNRTWLSKSDRIFPWQLYAIIASFFLLLFLSLDSDLEPIDLLMLQASFDESWLTFSIWCLAILGWMVVSFRQINYFKGATLLDYFFMIFPILFFAHLQIQEIASPLAVVLSGSLIGLMGSAIYLKKGIEENSLFFINVGMVLILAILSIRFFNTDWSDLWKGIVFVILGLIFLGLNVYLARRNREE